MITFEQIEVSTRLAVMDTISAYSIYYDENQLQAMEQLFTSEVRVDIRINPDQPMSIVGRSDVMEMYRQARLDVSSQKKRCRHFSTNPLFTTLDDERIHVRVNMLYTERSDITEVSLAGKYDFELVQINTKTWRIDRVVVGYDV